MAGFGGMHEHGGRAGRGQGGGNFASNVPAFSHSHHHHAAPDQQHHLHGTGKCLPQILLQTQHRGGFDVQGFLCQTNRPGRIKCRKLSWLTIHGNILSVGAALVSMSA